jgi:hypothetical protein
MLVKELTGLHEVNRNYPVYLVSFTGTMGADKYRYIVNGDMDYVNGQVQKLKKDDVFKGEATITEIIGKL